MGAPLSASDPIVAWLLDGDVSLQHQVWRDLLDRPRPELRARIAAEGWGARFLAARGEHGHWGQRYYQPKWTCTHYTLRDLRWLELPADVPVVHETLDRVFDEEIGADGGVSMTSPHSDVCVNGMVLDFAAWFGVDEAQLESVVDFVLGQTMADGGFNCRSNRTSCVHSSMHTTLSVLEGIHTYATRGYSYRLPELVDAAATSREFLWMHHLYRSDRTGEVIHRSFLKLHHPCRWRFDILRALDHFRDADAYDPRLEDALDVLRSKRKRDGRWRASRDVGKTHFDMEPYGKPSRWNTLRALRVLRWADSTSTTAG